ncbi:MAG: hypothetical protein KIT09_29740 [Bryobacteraceae bacterium]|nr:hypothetical protein [Bryobacteraceae bacterium]
MKRLYSLTAALLLGLPAGLEAGAMAFRPPSGVTLPLDVKPGEGWRQERDHWLLEANARGYLEAPAWWEGNRPPRGEMVVLTFDYLDDFRHPVPVEIFSGLGSENPYSEIHRIGGLGDKQWRSARVPASSDFIFVHEPSRAIRFRLVAAGAPLRAKNFQLAAPVEDEEGRYNSETRAWVEREQRRAVVSDRYFKLAQTPVIPGAWSDRPLVPYSRNWMSLVLPISAPQAGEAGAPLRVRMFRNEYEPVQIGVYANGRDLNNVRVSVDPLPAAAITVRVAEYSKTRGQLLPGYLVEPFPQRLWPAYPFDVPSGRSHLTWLVLHATEATSRPGRYSTTVRFAADGVGEVAIPLEIEILNARLLTMEEAELKLGGCTRGLVPEFELALLREYNHNMVNIWYASIRPQLAKDGESFRMDFRLMDDWMAAAKRQGIGGLVYFLGGDPYGFPQTMNLPRTLAATVLGLDNDGWRRLALENPEVLPDRIAPMMTEWSRRFGEHARAQEWPNVILTPFDEAAKYVQYRPGLGMLTFIKPQFKRQIRLLREGDPKVQIYGSIHHYDPGMDFLEDVDIFCTNAVHENARMPDEVRAAGKTLWEYSGTTDKGLPATARYTFGYYFAAHDSRGSLVWAYNWGNRFDTLDGSNWMYSWNTPFDVIPTPYLEGLREAWDDRRLLETLRRQARSKGVDLSGFLGRLFAEVAQARGQGGTDTVTDFWERAKNEAAMDEWRERMVNMLLRLQ